MDYSNMEELNDMAPKGSKAKIEMLGKYDYDRPDIIKDPYFVSIKQTVIKKLVILVDAIEKSNKCAGREEVEGLGGGKPLR